MPLKIRQLIFLIILTLSFLMNSGSFAYPFSILNDSLKNNKAVSVNKRLTQTLIISTAAYTSSLLVLNEIWYKQHPRQSFHFFNDNLQWKQMDKLGHFYSSYQINRAGMEALKRCGLNDKKAAFWGSLWGTAALTPIEVLDGFSAGYGASWGDALANAAGSIFYSGQYLIWNEERIIPKFSFHRSSLAPERPALLGDKLYEEIIKDYNGQTYWFSVDIDKFTNPTSPFPKWLNVSFGYGAFNMVYAEDEQNLAAGFDPYRQYFIGIDFDFSHIRSNNKYLKACLFLLRSVRLPAPALEINRKKGLILHPVYF